MKNKRFQFALQHKDCTCSQSSKALFLDKFMVQQFAARKRNARRQFSILYPRNRNLHIFNLSKIQIFFSAQKILIQLFTVQSYLSFGIFANQSYLFFGTFANAIYETDWFVYYLKKSLKKSFAMTTDMECSLIAPRPE